MIYTVVLEDYRVKPKARHRDCKNGKYSPSKKGEEDLSLLIINAFNRRGYFVKFENEVSVFVQIFSKKILSGDIDNYLKFIFDALQLTPVIENDRQIKEVYSIISEEEDIDLLLLGITELRGEEFLDEVKKLKKQ